MNARRIILPFLLVAAAAIGRWQFTFVDGFLDPRVAIDAVQFGMNGSIEGICRKQQRNRFSVQLTRRQRIKMTVKAVSIGNLVRYAVGGDCGSYEQ